MCIGTLLNMSHITTAREGVGSVGGRSAGRLADGLWGFGGGDRSPDRGVQRGPAAPAERGLELSFYQSGPLPPPPRTIY